MVLLATRVRSRIGWGWVLGCLLAAGCSFDAPEAPSNPGNTTSKLGLGQPGGWLSTPRLFLAGPRITSIAVTPNRLLATTVGPAPSKLVQITDAGTIIPFAPEFLPDPEATCFIEVSPGVLELSAPPAAILPGAAKAAGPPETGLPGDSDPVRAGDGQFGIGDIVAGSGSDLYLVSTDGRDQALVATLPAEDGPITGLAFDTAGGFHRELLVLTQSGAVHRMNAHGRTTAVGNVGPGASGPSVASSRLGHFTGQLLVAIANTHEVRAIDAAGNVSNVILWSGVSGAWTVPDDPRAFANSNGALFVATANGELYRYPLGDLSSRGGELLLTSLLRSGSGLVTPESGGLRTRSFSRFVGSEVAVGFVRRPSIMSVRIDVLPGVMPKRIVLGAMTILPVGLLAAPGFTPTMLTGGDVTFAGAPALSDARNRLGTLTDLDGDGQIDLLLQFRTAEMQLHAGDATLVLDGMSMVGDRVRGSNSVQIVAP